MNMVKETFIPNRYIITEGGFTGEINEFTHNVTGFFSNQINRFPPYFYDAILLEGDGMALTVIHANVAGV